MAEQMPSHPDEGFPAAHGVVASAPVDMDVHETRREVRVGVTVTTGPGRAGLDGCDPPIGDGDPAVLDTIVEDEPPDETGDAVGHTWRSETASGVSSGRFATAPGAARTPTRPAFASAPWIAAPIEPAHVPSSAGTTSTSARDVVRTRSRSSSRIGRKRRSPAAATPPPMTTLS